MLRTMVGTWRFEVWFAGNFDGPPDASGTRVVATLFDDLRVEWREEIDHSALTAQGVLGFDARANRFFATGNYSSASTPDLLTGTLDAAAPRITFRPIAVPPDTGAVRDQIRSSVLSIVDRDHLSWTALDNSWRAVLRRQPSQALEPETHSALPLDQ
jgi:hypothetical protein